MPCSSDGYGPSEREIWVQLAFPAACEMMRILTKSQRQSLSRKTKEWINEHDRYDREAREEKEAEDRRKAVKRSALDKLSPDEKLALGIY